MRIHRTALAGVVIAVSSGYAPSPPAIDGADIIAKSMAAYAALTSYADVGTVQQDAGGFVADSKFKTFYRKPRDFFYEYTQVANVYKDGYRVPLKGHLVYWMRNGNLETWHEASKTHESYPAGQRNQISPIANGDALTGGALPLVASFFFQKANLVTVVAELKKVSLAGNEKVNGADCYKLVGIAESTYPSGKTFNRRPVAIWIDAKTNLIKKVFIDTPAGYGAGSVSRTTITINPAPNPPLDDRKFAYTVPTQ